MTQTTDRHPEGGVATEARGHIFLIALDRPEKYNGFSPKMLQELGEAFTAFEENDDYHCAVLYANGKHFTAGLDLTLLDLNSELFPIGLVDPLSLRPPYRTKPLVTAVHGICFTIGIELALASDIVVAAADTRFSQLEVKRNIVAFGGATIRMMERAGWGNAMHYLLTGDEFNAEEALRLGFIQEIVEPGAQFDQAIEIAGRIAKQAPLAVRATLRSARTAALHGQDAAVVEFSSLVEKLKASEDFQEGVLSFKERREAVYKGR